ncbi:ribonuclease P protein component [Mycoplasmatota bacterium WC44]
MKKKYRVKKNEEIIDLLKNKKTVGDKYFVIYSLENKEVNNFRYALSVNKKYGNAPERNLIKRQVRSIIQMNSDNFKKTDIFIVIKLKAKELNYKEIEQKITRLIKRANLIKEE